MENHHVFPGKTPQTWCVIEVSFLKLCPNLVHLPSKPCKMLRCSLDLACWDRATKKGQLLGEAEEIRKPSNLSHFRKNNCYLKMVSFSIVPIRQVFREPPWCPRWSWLPLFAICPYRSSVGWPLGTTFGSYCSASSHARCSQHRLIMQDAVSKAYYCKYLNHI